ncbi:MAG: hypothetical protein JNJ65_07225 [Cyclobacteriaceae bacterium]|nr:hypothetical protein [Cyclobacteriaceae bacterium]
MKALFAIDKRITIGELMTVVSIVFSAISVLITWRNEQKIQIRENATRTRVEIAKTLNTVNQVIQIQLSFYELIEEDIVEASRIAIVEKEPLTARDYMWEKFYKHRAEVLNIISQNDWEVAYTNLLTYGITADSLYIRSINRLKKLQENQFNLALRAFEKEITDFRPGSSTQTSTLIDRLRKLKIIHRESHLEFAQIATAELNTFCLELIKETDKKLLFQSE